MAASLQLVAVGAIKDIGPPFHYFCTNAPNGLQPIKKINRPTTGLFKFTFNPAAFTGTPLMFISSVGVSGQGTNNANAYVRSIDTNGCIVNTNIKAGNAANNTSFSFLIVEFPGPVADTPGIEGP